MEAIEEASDVRSTQETEMPSKTDSLFPAKGRVDCILIFVFVSCSFLNMKVGIKGRTSENEFIIDTQVSSSEERESRKDNKTTEAEEKS